LGSYYGKTIKNTKGETLKQVDKNRDYVPQGRDKTDFNYFRMAFTFVDSTHKRAFEMIFE
jgi:hypothetical protein